MKAKPSFEWPPPSASSETKQLGELAKLLDRPSPSVDDLTITVSPPWPGDVSDDDADWEEPSTLQPLVDVLAQRERPTLHRLALADFGAPYTESEDWQDLGDLGELWAKLPALQRLVLQGESMLLGKLDLPNVRDVVIRGSLRRSALASIAEARWPQIERLEILFGDPTVGAEGSIDDVRPILAGAGMPRLRHLGLRFCAFVDDIVSNLDQLRLLPQLETLDFLLAT